MTNQTKPSASYWGRIAGGNLAGGAAYLAAISKIPKGGGKLGAIGRYGAGLIADQAATASGEAVGSQVGKEIDRTTHHKVVDMPHENGVQQVERTSGETLGSLGGMAVGMKHGFKGGVAGAALGAIGGNYIAGKLADSLRHYHPSIAHRIHRSAMS